VDVLHSRRDGPTHRPRVHARRHGVAGSAAAGPLLLPYGCVNDPGFDFLCGGVQPHHVNCQFAASPDPSAGCTNPSAESYCYP
jgi:hypothetical protein